jgi:hypothetical protein
MATLRTQYAVAGNADVIQLVEMAAYQQATIVQQEPSGTTNHAARSAYAHTVLHGSVDFAELARVVLAQPGAAGVSANPLPTDAQVVAFLASLWDALSA